MDLATLKRLLISLSPEEVDELYARFQTQTNGADLDHFVLYLHRQRRISDEELKGVEARGGVELTGFDAIRGNAAGRGSEAPSVLQRISGYTALEEIGAGSMGAILLARDNELRRKVAYKHIHREIAANPRLVDRFCSEAQLTAQLEHPAIVPIYGLVVEADGNVGYAMKLIHGNTLGDLFAEARRQLDERGAVDERHALPVLLEHFLKVCDAVHYAHRKGVIHRDLKPENIMVGADHEVYVMDWGIARVIGAPEPVDGGLPEGEEEVSTGGEPGLQRTRVGELLGTPMYMSPEQAGGAPERLDPRSDLFTLGLILFELATLRRPHPERTLDDLLPRVRAGRLGPFVPYSRQLRVPAELKAIVGRACAPEPRERYRTVAEFAAEIRRFLAGEAVHALPDTATRKLMRWMGKHREATLLAVAGVLLVSVTVASWTLYLREEERIQAMEREQQLSGFLTAVAGRANRIDRQFLRVEAAVAGIAAATTQLLQNGRPDPGPYYTVAGFSEPGGRPPDLAPAPSYGAPVSAAWPDIKIAPGVEESAIEDTIRRLTPLRHTYRRLFTELAAAGAPGGAATTAEAVIGRQALPIAWAYVGLEAGFLSSYPAVGDYPEAYDPRERPWYREAVGHTGTAWVRPYVDVAGQGWMLPCTKPLFDDDGELLGVAAMDMRLDYLRERLLRFPDTAGVERVLLLDQAGHVVADTRNGRSAPVAKGTLINTLADLPLYPHPQVLARVRDGGSGHLDLEVDGEPRTIAFYRVESVDWTLVVEAHPDRLVAPPAGPGPAGNGSPRAGGSM